MSEQSHRSHPLSQTVGLLIGVASLVLAVTVPEVRRLIGLDPPAAHPPDRASGSGFSNVGDSTATDMSLDVASPAPISAETLPEVQNEPVWDTVSVTQTVVTETTVVQP